MQTKSTKLDQSSLTPFISVSSVSKIVELPSFLFAKCSVVVSDSFLTCASGPMYSYVVKQDLRGKQKIALRKFLKGMST